MTDKVIHTTEQDANLMALIIEQHHAKWVDIRDNSHSGVDRLIGVGIVEDAERLLRTLKEQGVIVSVDLPELIGSTILTD